MSVVLAFCFCLSLGLCLPVQHSGYITVNEKENGRLFYWLVESMQNPATDPVVLWVSGGPGCSGGLAMFMENGPWTVNSNLTLNPNPYTWNNYATVIWIDQPVGTGYSFAKTDYVTDEKQVAVDMHTFLQGFFKEYSQYRKQDFFISGESYGGKYVPTMANMILIENAKHPETAINLKGISIGNGDVAPIYQFPVQADAALLANVITKEQYAKIKPASTECERLLNEKQWSKANQACNEIIIEVLKAAGNINPMNYKIHCQIQDCFNYPNVTNYLNLAKVKASLGVPPNVTWQACNFDIQFTDEDQMASFIWEVTDILHAGLRVLIYYGDLDLVCPWNGGLNWMMHTPWTGQEEFQKAPVQPWRWQGGPVGNFKVYQNFQYVKVFGAGHMAPGDQPEVTLEMFRRFLLGLPF